VKGRPYGPPTPTSVRCGDASAKRPDVSSAWQRQVVR
jgi:hypothetical protein